MHACCTEISHFVNVANYVSVHMTSALFLYGPSILTGLRASIGVTRSHSSHPYLCTLVMSMEKQLGLSELSIIHVLWVSIKQSSTVTIQLITCTNFTQI